MNFRFVHIQKDQDGDEMEDEDEDEDGGELVPSDLGGERLIGRLDNA